MATPHSTTAWLLDFTKQFYSYAHAAALKLMCDHTELYAVTETGRIQLLWQEFTRGGQKTTTQLYSHSSEQGERKRKRVKERQSERKRVRGSDREMDHKLITGAVKCRLTDERVGAYSHLKNQEEILYTAISVENQNQTVSSNINTSLLINLKKLNKQKTTYL